MKFLFLISGVLAFLLVPFLWWIFYGAHDHRCKVMWNESGMEYKYQFWGGCKVSEDKGKTWIPADNWRKDI